MTCSKDTDGDGNCGSVYCPECGIGEIVALLSSRPRQAPLAIGRYLAGGPALRSVIQLRSEVLGRDGPGSAAIADVLGGFIIEQGR